ncbi:MAG: TRAP transporter TatT component family protein, partial [Wenzhouxiangella sp.]
MRNRLLAKLTVVVAMTATLLAGGCVNLLDRAAVNFADDLESAIRSYDDPSTVEAGLPAYLLLLEARLQSRPDDAALLLTTARLTTTYATLFGNAQQKTEQQLTRRALDHARAGACAHSSRLCGLNTLHVEDLEARTTHLLSGDLDAVYVLATTWTSWIAAHSDDFMALADLPRVERLLEWVAEREPSHDDGAAWLYLAVLNSQRPPAAGGQPRKARTY